MLDDLEYLLERPANRDVEAADLERAADRLLHQQCLFRDDWNSRRTYELVVRFKGYFGDLFTAIGRDLMVNERELMVELRPRESMARVTLSLDETILLLSLRAAFEQGVTEFSQGDHGEVEITSMDLLERHDPMTGRPRPPWPRVRDILKSFERRRFVALGEEFPEESGVLITIRPAIRGVTGEGWLARIEAFLQSRDERAAAPDEEGAAPRESTGGAGGDADLDDDPDLENGAGAAVDEDGVDDIHAVEVADPGDGGVEATLEGETMEGDAT